MQRRSYVTSQQTRDIDPMLFHCWPIVCDDGRTVKQHCVNVSCMLCSTVGYSGPTLAQRVTHPVFPCIWQMAVHQDTGRWVVSLIISVNSLSRNQTKYEVDNRYRLRINHLGWEDEGAYECDMRGEHFQAFLLVIGQSHYIVTYPQQIRDAQPIFI